MAKLLSENGKKWQSIYSPSVIATHPTTRQLDSDWENFIDSPETSHNAVQVQFCKIVFELLWRPIRKNIIFLM